MGGPSGQLCPARPKPGTTPPSLEGALFVGGVVQPSGLLRQLSSLYSGLRCHHGPLHALMRVQLFRLRGTSKSRDKIRSRAVDKGKRSYLRGNADGFHLKGTRTA